MSARDRRLAAWMCFVVVVLWTIPIWAQGSGQTGVEAGSGTAGNDPGAVLSTQFVISYFFAWVIQLIKRSSSKALSLFTEGADVANRVLASLFAVAQAVGIAVHFDTAAGTLMVTGLSVALIWPAVVELARAYISQKLLYLLAFKRPEGATIPELKEAVR